MIKRVIDIPGDHGGCLVEIDDAPRVEDAPRKPEEEDDEEDVDVRAKGCGTSP